MFLSGQELEAASIKKVPTRSGELLLIDSGTGGPGTDDPGMFRCGHCFLGTLIEKAFGLQRYQFEPPLWMMTSEYQLLAKIPEKTTPQDFRTMLQGFLKERFRLTYHFEPRAMDGLSMVTIKGGPKQSARATGKTMAEFAELLGGELNRPVEDATGLSGYYDVNVAWKHSADGPSFGETLEDQLRLKLIPKKVQTRIFVINHVDRSPAAN